MRLNVSWSVFKKEIFEKKTILIGSGQSNVSISCFDLISSSEQLLRVLEMVDLCSFHYVNFQI